MGQIILVTGGQRSGKSSYSERLALSKSPNPIYMATARVWDEEFRIRIERHKKGRGDRWVNIEEEKYLSKHNMSGKVVVIDCVTLWSTNFFYDLESDVQLSLEALKSEFEKFTVNDGVYIFVTNEIGLGGVSDNMIQRKFTDLLGWFNQYIASRADTVIFMVSGIPIKIK